MAACTAWFCVFGCAETVAAAIRGELTAAGIDLEPFDDTTGNGRFGIVCFAQISDELFELLAVVRSASCRILAVAASIAKIALPVWQLLQAGASDALIWDNHGVAASQLVQNRRTGRRGVCAGIFCRREPGLACLGAKGRGGRPLHHGPDFADR
jgi:hypothetical protein